MKKYWVRFLPEFGYKDGDVTDEYKGSEVALVEYYLECLVSAGKEKHGGHWLSREVDGQPTILCIVAVGGDIGLIKGMKINPKWKTEPIEEPKK